MDDVGGRRRGLRETPSLELFQALSDHYGITYDTEVVDRGGVSNDPDIMPDGHEIGSLMH